MRGGRGKGTPRFAVEHQRSELESGAELNSPRAEGTGYYAKGGLTKKVEGRVVKVDAVEQIKEISRYGEPHALGDFRLLADRKIEVPQRYPSQHAAPRPAVRIEVDLAEAVECRRRITKNVQAGAAGSRIA